MTFKLKDIKNGEVRAQTKRLLNAFRNEEAYLYHVSKWDSVYIKFPNKALGSIRLGDHNGREKYRYRWNVRYDFSPNMVKVEEDRGVSRLYVGKDQLAVLIQGVKMQSVLHEQGRNIAANIIEKQSIKNEKSKTDAKQNEAIGSFQEAVERVRKVRHSERGGRSRRELLNSLELEAR